MASACLVRMGFTNAAAAELTSAAGQDLSTLVELQSWTVMDKKHYGDYWLDL